MRHVNTRNIDGFDSIPPITLQKLGATLVRACYIGPTMISLIEDKQLELSRLCRQFRIERLDLFGSAATERFDPESSDLDFVVKFSDTQAPGYADRYFDFAEALELLFQRHVDLVTERSIRNPYFRQAVEGTRQSVYEC